MDTREHYQTIIEQTLLPYAERRYSGEDITNEAVFDRERGRFIIASLSLLWASRATGAFSKLYCT